MHEPNQGGAEDTRSDPAHAYGAAPDPNPDAAPVPAPDSGFGEDVHAAATWGDEAPRAGDEVPAVPAGPPVQRGLAIWLILIAVFGVVGLVFRQIELALMVTLAGAFAAAHAADRDPAYRPLHLILTGVLVAGGALLFGGLAVWLATQAQAGPLRPLAAGIAGGGAVLSVLTAWRPLSDGLTYAVFRTLHSNHVLRLGARVVLMVLLFLIPGYAAFPTLIDMVEQPGPLLDTAQLLSSLVGLTVLAFGGVGFLVSRDTRATLERLGLRMPRPIHLLVVAAGVVGLYLLNVGVESIQRTFFPALYQHDERINHMLAGGLGTGGMVLLGLSAGIGEELAMRGALQPRLGIVFTAVVFASLHVHYSWIGMGTILLLGITLGVLRLRTSTTVAILVHSIYDMLAVVASRNPTP